jgi:ubiquinone/menaquinone biosynthesis C-methylase UbiE
MSQMRAEQFQQFIDPNNGVPLRLQNSVPSGEDIISGDLVSQDGQIRGTVKDSIPRFVSPDNYAANFGLQWRAHAGTQLDSRNGSNYSAQRIFESTGWPADMRGQRILEAGSGAGRFTEILAKTGADLFTFDFSRAVEANYSNNKRFPNVCFFQADIYRIPLPDEYFDRVICLGVLQHTPDVAATFQALARKVKPGGYLAVDVYPKTIWQVVHWKYLLRPITTRMKPEPLYTFVKWYAPKLMPLAKIMRGIGGRAAARLVPILDQSDKNVAPEVQLDWTILDTYDALSAAYDQPQTDRTIREWYKAGGFDVIEFNDGAGWGRKSENRAI